MEGFVMAGAVLKSLAGLLAKNWGKVAIAGGSAYAFRDEIKEGFSEISENPEETVEATKEVVANAGETAKKVASTLGETIDGARSNIEGAFNFAQDPASAVIDKIKSETEDNFDFTKAGAWLAGIVGGGLLLNKVFGGNDDDDKNKSKSGFPWGITLLVVAGALAYLNRDSIMDMGKNITNNNNGINHMDPSSFDIG